jgi:hypothetical protein
MLIPCELGVRRDPALIAVEAESATDLPHRGTHAFLAATEVAPVRNDRERAPLGSDFELNRRSSRDDIGRAQPSN